MTQRIALILGVGKNIGAQTVQTFKNKNYRIAQAARSLANHSDESDLSITCDFSQPASVSTAFETVRKTWGDPSVVIYNAAAAHFTNAKESFNISTEVFEQNLSINVTSPFVAAREAIAGFQRLPTDTPKTFIYTGNTANEAPLPGFLTLGVGKTATAHAIELADKVYREDSSDMKFYYVDERHADGTPMFTGLGGQAHADMFMALAERKAGADVPWQVTFVSGQGYKAFPHELILAKK